MPLPPPEFQERIKAIVNTHYASTRAPLLLSSLGGEIEKLDAWPTDRGQRNLKQLILDTCRPDLDIVRDRRSPAYIAVVTPDVRADVEAQIAQRFGENEVAPVRLEDVVKPVLLAFCINVERPVYVKRTRPFRYEVGSIAQDQVGEYIIVEREYRRPGLRVDRPQLLSRTDRKDLENRIQRWATVHEVSMEQFSRLAPEENDVQESQGRTALDRLLSAQALDVAQRLMIPADIAQILSRIR